MADESGKRGQIVHQMVVDKPIEEVESIMDHVVAKTLPDGLFAIKPNRDGTFYFAQRGESVCADPRDVMWVDQGSGGFIEGRVVDLLVFFLGFCGGDQGDGFEYRVYSDDLLAEPAEDAGIGAQVAAIAPRLRAEFSLRERVVLEYRPTPDDRVVVTAYSVGCGRQD